MTIEIRKLTPDLADDFFDFFDYRAFSDRKGAFCYCTWFHFDCSIEEHYKYGKDAMRNQAAEYIASGKLNGYLAFIDGVSIGWCNADNKENFRRIKTDPFIRGDNAEGIKSIVCFEISPEYRGKGVYQNLLNFIMSKLKAEGYVRLGVDFESINPTAWGFWLKHFTAYTHSVVRRADEYALKKGNL